MKSTLLVALLGSITILVASLAATSRAASCDSATKTEPVVRALSENSQADGSCLSRSAAQKLLASFRKLTESDHALTVYCVPGQRNLYLIAGMANDNTEEDYGPRFFLVSDHNGIKIEARSIGMSDSYYLRPVFFRSGDQILVAADTGAEESWGLATFLIASSRLRFLGFIHASVRGREGLRSPLPFAQACRRNDHWLIGFDTDLVRHDHSGKVQKLARKGTCEIIFEWNGTELARSHELCRLPKARRSSKSK